MGGVLEAPSQVWEVSIRATSVVDGCWLMVWIHFIIMIEWYWVVGGEHERLHQTDISTK
jgi:hypothetical protein